MIKEVIEPLRAQLKRLNQMAFYKQKLENAGIHPSDIGALDDFQKIPFTTTSELMKELRKKPSESSLYSDDVTRIKV